MGMDFWAALTPQAMHSMCLSRKFTTTSHTVRETASYKECRLTHDADCVKEIVLLRKGLIDCSYLSNIVGIKVNPSEMEKFNSREAPWKLQAPVHPVQVCAFVHWTPAEKLQRCMVEYLFCELMKYRTLFSLIHRLYDYTSLWPLLRLLSSSSRRLPFQHQLYPYWNH